VIAAFLHVLLWMILAEGDLSSLVIGAPFIAAGAAVARLRPAGADRVRPTGAVRFAVVFLGKCCVAGVDVAKRAFGPRGAIRPGFVEHEFSIPEGAPRTLLANVVSLLPGTMSAAVDGDVLRLHVLDTRLDVAREMAALEALVAGVFGVASTVVDPAEGGFP
jgi:multicomponent Na+:H+ antiporter subunit E